MPNSRPTLSLSQIGRVSAYAGLGAWFAASVFSQHPVRVFDRIRHHDPTGILFPDWRFFAPEPARHDFVLLYRTLEQDGEQSPWHGVEDATRRSWKHAVWFPRRRIEKGLYDLCDQILQHLSLIGDDGTRGPAYALMRGVVRGKIRAERGSDLPTGFQFMIARSGGYDEREEPEYVYCSRFERMHGA
jgi:hypothetical protein